jgi:ketosteroid isomerase-like protein
MQTHARSQLVKFCVVLFLCCAFASPGPAQDSDTQHDEARVRALEVLWNQAELKKDAKALDQVLADRFIYTDIDGSLERKAEFLESVRDPTEHITSIGTESISVEAYDDTVIAYGVYVEKGTSNGKPYLHHGRFTDTWIKQGQQWRCVASHATLMHK